MAFFFPPCIFIYLFIGFVGVSLGRGSELPPPQTPIKAALVDGVPGWRASRGCHHLNSALNSSTRVHSHLCLP